MHEVVCPPFLCQIRDLEDRMMEFEEDIMCHSCHTTDKDLLNFQTDFYGMFIYLHVASSILWRTDLP